MQELKPDQFALYFQSQDLPGVFAKGLTVPPGMRAQVRGANQVTELPEGEYALENLAERLNTFFRGSQAKIYLFRQAPLAVELDYANLLSAEFLPLTLRLRLTLTIADIDAFRNAFMSSIGAVGSDVIREAIKKDIHQVLMEVLAQHHLPEMAQMRAGVLRAKLEQALLQELTPRLLQLGLGIGALLGMDLQHPRWDANHQLIGELWLIRHEKEIRLADATAWNELYNQEEQNQIRANEREMRRMAREFVAKATAEELAHASAMTQARQAAEREKQALELEAIRQHHAREQGRAQQAQEQTLAQQATLAAQEAQHQAEKDRIAADQLRQEGEMRSATSKHEQQLATIAALSSVPRETLLMNADSDMKVQAMANVLLAQIVASHNLQPEQILALATMLQPIAAQQANHQAIRNGITPPDLTQFFQARPAQQRHLHLSFLNENGHEVTRAAVNDDFILQIDLAQKGYFALFAFGTGKYFSQLFPTTLVSNTALEAGRYLLPGERLLPLPNAFFGPEVERMYFDEAGQEVLLGCLLPSKPGGELAQWLRPLEPDSRLSDARMQAILSALDECADAGIMLASITIEPARSRFR